MANQLIFKSHTLDTIEHDGKLWFTAATLATALDYSRGDKITQIYNRNADEFTQGMSLNLNLRVSGNINGLQHKKTRIFSLRGAHLIGMFASTPVAKEFRKWVLDILERESTPAVNTLQPVPASPEQAPELFRSSDIDNLSSMIQSMSNGFRFERSWSNAIWYALRREVGVPSPRRFEVWQIPLLAEACQRLFIITDRLKAMTLTAERQMVRRVLRNREDAEAVLTEMQQLMDKDICQKHTLRAEALEKWQHVSLATFLYRH